MDVAAYLPPILARAARGPLRLIDAERARARSHGRVLKPETINYRTHEPERGGLFCADIFGAEAERGERFGHIELAIPVLHPWLAEPVAAAASMTPEELRAVLRAERFLEVETGALATEQEADGREAFAIGGGAIAARLERLGAAEAARAMLRVLLVLPPALRDIAPLGAEGRFAIVEVNDLYRRVINRNHRLRRLQELCAPEIILRNEGRMVQEAVEALFDNERCATPVLGPKKELLRSLCAMAERAVEEGRAADAELAALGFEPAG